MLDTIAKGFRAAKNRMQGFRELDEATVEEAVKDIRASLLEADVEFGVANRFLGRVRDKAVGEIVKLAATDTKGKKVQVTPEQHFIKICHDELEGLMGPVDTSIKRAKMGISKLMLIGLQGSGKTTTIAKLARKLQKEGHKPMLVAADVYRPAAIEQLQTLGKKLNVPVYTAPGVMPPDLCLRSLDEARRQKCDFLLFDTAGRLAIDEQLMTELVEIKQRTSPDNVFLVIDAMMGQDAVQTAKRFHETVGLDGVILTKLDGDARGGAALSVKEVTGAPIKFLGMGESLDKLEEFRPEGLASRILGMGDIVSLMKDFEGVVDEKKAEEDAKKMLKGEFTLVHFLDQIKTLKKMGSLRDVMEKLPFFADAMADGAKFDDRELVKIEAIIQSMTPKERDHPELIDKKRAERIAKGCGKKVQDIADLLQRYKVMREMMVRIGSTPGLLSKLPGFNQLGKLAQMKNMDVGEFFDELEAAPDRNAPLATKGPAKQFDRKKRKEKNRQAAQSRKKNRKR